MNFNEHENTHDSINQHGLDDGATDDVTMPLGAGDFSDQDAFVTDESSQRKLNSGALLIVVVVVIAAIGLFSMRTLTRVSASDGEPEVIAQSIDEFLTEVMQKGQGAQTGQHGVLEVLNESYAARQVPLEEVQRNPFILFEDVAGDTPAVSAPTDTLAPRRRARTTQFEQAAGRLRLNMILMGAEPLATVNNRIVRIGEVIQIEDAVEFRVVSITANQVEFIAEDTELDVSHEVTLSLRRN